METMTEATTRLAANGYVGQFLIRNGNVECHSCNSVITADQLTVEETVRFEGISDPGDESVLFAITDHCGHKGTLIATYGPEMSPEEAEIVSHLHDRGDRRIPTTELRSARISWSTDSLQGWEGMQPWCCWWFSSARPAPRVNQ